MTLSWNEIRQRANDFVAEWLPQAKNASEKSQDQAFMTGFLDIFDKQLRKKAEMQYPVNFGKEELTLFGQEPGKGKKGWIDCFVPRLIAIEMKSPGIDLDKAFEQIRHYKDALPVEVLPNGLLVCDFNTFVYYDYTTEMQIDPVITRFTLEELPKKVELFYYLAGFKKAPVTDINPVDIEAAERMGELYSAMVDSGYEGHQLEMYLVRLLFCLFAEDSGIFERKNMFFEYIGNYTRKDGSDLAAQLEQIFETLNKPKEKRLKTLDEKLNEFPYINGNLFEERLDTAAFNTRMRDTLLKCCNLDWSQIKPEIFGAMFQSVKSKEARRELGEHYTSEKNIMKIVRPLFLDKLRDEFKKIKAIKSAGRAQKLLEFHDKLRRLKFLDPACGCGNFLVVSYRELRKLEIDVLSEYIDGTVLDIELCIRVNVDQFYGIEIEEFPARIAQTALWLMDHLMNIEASKKFGKYITRIPLTASPHIVIGNALALDWETVVPKNKLSFILGNPPFIGSKMMTEEQRRETVSIFNGVKNSGILDYVCCWYAKATQYIQDTSIEAAFVSTNSICQGEQAPVLWPYLMNNGCRIKLNFAHQTFKWNNEARGKAAVFCVIIGFGLADRPKKKIYHYADASGEPVEDTAKNINGYLVDYDNVYIISRQEPLCDVPKMSFGNMPLDGNNLIFSSDEEKNEFLKMEPGAKKYIKRLISAREFLNGGRRWCLWLVGVEPGIIRKMPEVMKRIEAVKKWRLASKAPSTRGHAATPALFRDRNNPKSYIVVPRVSSAARQYIPMGFFGSREIAGDTCMTIPDATIYHFGILNSGMHMAWVRYVCGRLGMGYRYSKDIVYNNFPWPSPTEKQKADIERYAQNVLDARTRFPKSALADLYDPLAMPPELNSAHHNLDKAVESAYGKSFTNDADRVAYLFYLYEIMNRTLHAPIVKKARNSNK